MRSLPALLSPRAAALAAALATLALAACGTSVTEPTAKRSLSPSRVAADGTPTDTAANRPTIPWY